MQSVKTLSFFCVNSQGVNIINTGVELPELIEDTHIFFMMSGELTVTIPDCIAKVLTDDIRKRIDERYNQMLEE